MTTDLLYKAYPWYRRHQQAVDTLAKFLGCEVYQVLEGLDKKSSFQDQVPKEGGMQTAEAA